MRRLLLATTALLALAVSAKADVILGGQTWDTSSATTITVTNAVPAGNQVQNIPCIICGDNQPQQPAGFGYNDFGNTGNETDIRMFSSGTVAQLANDTIGTAYQAAFLINFLQAAGDANLSFSVGLDVNDTSQAQTLASFYFLDLTTHTVLSAMTTPTLVPDINNGTGFPDYTLTGLTLQGVNPGDQLLFFSRITNANDGPDSFFFQAGVTSAVPEASTWAMMLIGFLGVGLVATRKRREGRGFRFV